LQFVSGFSTRVVASAAGTRVVASAAGTRVDVMRPAPASPPSPAPCTLDPYLERLEEIEATVAAIRTEPSQTARRMQELEVQIAIWNRRSLEADPILERLEEIEATVAAIRTEPSTPQPA
jgi:hypothetical protein